MNSCFFCLCVWEIFIKKKTSIALKLHVFVLSKPYVELLDTKLYTYVPCCLHWASSNFVTLVRCLSYLFDQDHVHSTSWTSTLEVSYAIPSIHKIKLHVYNSTCLSYQSHMLIFLIQTLHICALLFHWASSNFVTLVRCLSCLFDQDHVHSTSWTSTLEVSYAIPSIHKNKTPCLMISLSSILQMRHVLSKKKENKRWPIRS